MATTEINVPVENDVAVGLRRFLVKVCVSVALFVLFLGAGELMSYIYLRLHPPPSVYAGLPLSADYARELNESAKHQYLPYVEWRRRPYQGQFISVDEEGVRRSLNSHCEDAKSLHIWMFGDSTLWGTGVSDDSTIPSQLAQLYTDSGQSVCIKNFGESAWVSTQELIELLLQLKHTDRRPDIVAFYDGTDEIFMPDPDAPKDVHQGYRRFRELLDNSQAEAKPGLLFLRKSNTAHALDLLSQKFNRGRSKNKRSLPSAEVEAVAEATINNYQQNLEVVDALARAYGFRPFYFWYPTSIFGKKQLTAEEQKSLREERQDAPSRSELIWATYSVCSKIDHPGFFFLGGALDDAHDWIYLDGAHLTKQGNRIMAEKLFQILRSNKASLSR